MKYPDNIEELGRLPIHLMGMIFYEKSPRFVENVILSDAKIDRVGVFVNAEQEYIKGKVDDYNLKFVQLHGNESPEFVKELNKSIPVIKAFSISEVADLEQTERYEGLQGYFLFDTKTPQYGGSGQKFDWSILDNYKGNTPFLLSGGISIDDAKAIKQIKHPKFAGVDLNSRFEIEPGLKDINLLHQLINVLKDEQN